MSRRFQIDEMIGDYRVVDFIGQGGMGEVYHFFHEKLNRSVAVKVLGSNGGLDASSKQRFLNEARLQSSLQHPNIATFYDFQEVGKELLIFMELVDGETLEDLAERRFYSIEESLKVFESIVGAIGYVHSNGILHRDIKAENVKVNSSGQAKLLDFGIAKDTNSQALTRVGGVIGTPKYLAPEQFDGKPASIQTDIWSLGILLYKMLTGKTPFEGEILEQLILQIIQGNYQPAENLNPAVPKEVSNIIKRCLALDASQRYQTTDELLRDVRQILRERYHTENNLAEVKRKKSLPVVTYSLAGAAVFLIFFLLTIAIVTFSSSAEIVKVNENAGRKTNGDNQNINQPIIKKTEPTNIQIEKKNDLASVQTNSDKGGKTVRIDAIGGSAEVWRNGQKIGNTPLDLEVADSEVVSLKLRRQGYFDSDVKVESMVGKKVYTFSLEPK